MDPKRMCILWLVLLLPVPMAGTVDLGEKNQFTCKFSTFCLDD